MLQEARRGASFRYFAILIMILSSQDRAADAALPVSEVIALRAPYSFAIFSAAIIDFQRLLTFSPCSDAA